METERKNKIKQIKKRNKEYDNKCSNIYNHIQILKKREENFKKQLSNLEKKEKLEQKIQEDKQKIKLALEKKKNEKNIELEKKKEKIKNLKNKEEFMLKETKNRNINMKRKRYQSALNDKRIFKNIKHEIDKQQNNKNCFRHAKVKQQYYEGKTDKLKKSLDKKREAFIQQENDLKKLKIIEKQMVKTFNKLELIEKECMDNLYKTKSLNEKFKEKKQINIYKNIDIKNKKEKATSNIENV